MRAICVDDEELILMRTVSLVKRTNRFDEVESFTDAREALAFLDENKAELALLDIDMPVIGGLDLASGIKEKCPGIKVVFLTGYSQYAVDAYAMHASGYLLKPIGYDRLLEEIDFALGSSEDRPVTEKPIHQTSKIRIQTFGYFNILVDGRPVIFKRSKAKELIACLVDRQGQFISRKDLFYIIWEDENYDRTKQKYLDTIIRSLKDTLDEYGISEIFEMEKGFMRVVPEKVDCDLFRFLAKDKSVSFRGEYMSSYSWASMTEGYLTGLMT